MDIKQMKKKVASYNGKKGRENLRKKLGKKGFSDFMKNIRAKGLKKKGVDKSVDKQLA